MLEVFITDLQAYNEGSLVGRWVTLPVEPEELTMIIADVLKDGEEACGTQHHEEYFLTDWDCGQYSLFDVGEYSNVIELNEQLQQLSDKSDHDLKALSFLMKEGIASTLSDAIDKVDDVRIYENQSMEDIAYDLVHDCYSLQEVPSIIANHIDYEAIGRDLQLDGNYYEYDNDIMEYVG